MNRDRLWKFQRRAAPYLFMAPLLILFSLFLAYPIYRSLALSFYKTAGRREIFIGLANYRFLFSDILFWGALANTLAFAVLSLIIQVPAALGLAVLLNHRSVRFRSLFRFAFFVTHVVGSVFLAILFAVLLSPRTGLINRALGGLDINWLGRSELVLPAMLLASLWVTLGFGMIYFLAALQSVDRELYEAAEVDGAGKWARFRHVTLPGIWPVLIFMVLVNTIAALQLFELPYVLFQGGAGPRSRGLTIVMYLFQTGFQAGDLGYASAIGWVLMLLILVAAIVQLRSMRAMRENP